MAFAPTPEQAEALVSESRQADEQKRAAQAELGKEFENHGQGVMPEEVWQNLPGKQEEVGNGS